MFVKYFEFQLNQNRLEPTDNIMQCLEEVD